MFYGTMGKPWETSNPFRFVRRGRAAKRDDPDFDIVSDVDDAELVTWLEKPGLGTALQLIQQPGDEKKMAKYLPPGTVSDLFHHYEAARQLIGAKSVSFFGLNLDIYCLFGKSLVL